MTTLLERPTIIGAGKPPRPSEDDKPARPSEADEDQSGEGETEEAG